MECNMDTKPKRKETKAKKIERLKKELAEVSIITAGFRLSLGRISNDNYMRLLGRHCELVYEINELQHGVKYYENK